MTAIPSVQYVRNGEFTLAYQVTGSGSKDLVYLLFETPNVVGNWFDPLHASFMERLASLSVAKLAPLRRPSLGEFRRSDRVRARRDPSRRQPPELGRAVRPFRAPVARWRPGSGRQR
jgi:hypothetical protein